ncbi:MAG: transporter [Sphingomonas bacterium]|uniref:MFS transporter n=1 Tax=Sphingomonas bacterium TaxID=1895847 RepID=UPI0026253554|nr:MFS transporter [Sphingomonas bacterium]MDB5694910.1 transporter [Sphingomonas bacterium]
MRSSRASILLLAALHFCAHADRALPAALAPVLRDRFALSDAEQGLLHGPAFILPFALGAAAIGALGARTDPRRLVVASVIAWTVAGLMSAAATSFDDLLLARVALGIGQAGFAPAALALLSGFDRPATAISSFTAGSAAGRSGGLLIAGLLLTLATGGTLVLAEPWRMATLWLIVPNLALLAMLLFDARSADPPSAATRPHGTGGLRALAAHPRAFIAHVTGASAAVLIVQAGGAWASSIVHRGFAVEPGAAAALTGAVILFTAPAGHLLAGRYDTERAGWAPGPMIAGGATVAMAACLLLAVAPVLPIALLAIGLLSIGGGFAAAAALIGLQPLVAPDDRLAVNAAYFATVSLVGFGIGPLVTGVASDRLGGAGDSLALALAAVVAVAAVVAGAAALAGTRAWRHVVRTRAGGENTAMIA